MDWKSHLFIAAAASIAALSLFFPNIPPAHALLLAGACCASALLPDFDHPKSKARAAADTALITTAAAISLATYISSNSLQGAAAIFACVIALWLAFSKIIIPRHRGLLHSLAFAAFFAACILVLSGDPALSLFALIGYLSHMAADASLKLL